MKIYDTRQKEKEKKKRARASSHALCACDKATVLISQWLELELCE